MPKYVLTAPNGQTLEVSGNHYPTEAEQATIFREAGVSTRTFTRESVDGKVVEANGDREPTEAQWDRIFAGVGLERWKPGLEARTRASYPSERIVSGIGDRQVLATRELPTGGRAPMTITDSPAPQEPKPAGDRSLIGNVVDWLKEPPSVQKMLTHLDASAHPQTLDDMMALLVYSSPYNWWQLGKTYVNRVRDAAAEVTRLRDIPGRVIRDSLDIIKTGTPRGERQWQQLPLAKQMEGLPTKDVGPGVAPGGRQAPPPYQPSPTPFTEKPLYQQMEELPTKDVAPLGTSGRQATPRQTATPREQTPFNDLPLSKQGEHLPTNTPPPERMRSSGPPVQTGPPKVRMVGELPVTNDMTQNEIAYGLGRIKQGATPEQALIEIFKAR